MTTLGPVPSPTEFYLPGRHGLRFLAAVSVFFGRPGQAKVRVNYEELPGISFLRFRPMALKVGQLRPGPVKWSQLSDLNRRPTVYKTVALPLS